MLKAKCLNPNCNSKRFVTVATVTEDWVVDEHGNFIHKFGDDCGSGETVHGPNKDNTWTCDLCGAEAIVEDVCNHIPDHKTVRPTTNTDCIMEIKCALCGCIGSFSFEDDHAEIMWNDNG
jgi:hypothetical protein